MEAEKISAVIILLSQDNRVRFLCNCSFVVLSRENKRLISQSLWITVENQTNECLFHLINDFSLKDLCGDCREDS